MNDIDITRVMALLGTVIFTAAFWATVLFGLLLAARAVSGTL